MGNLYRLMRGYATGVIVGTPGSMADSRSQASGTFEQNNHVVINNDGHERADRSGCSEGGV
nr:hypothetical protein [Escherichia coli]